LISEASRITARNKKKIMESIVFQFEAKEVRFVGTPEDPWWVAADVCAVLEIKNPSQAISRLDDEDKSMLNIGVKFDMWCVSESGMYSLILGSRKPQARRFKRWLTSEVIPSIRKTGSYSTKSKVTSTASPALIQEAVSAVFSVTNLDKNLVAGVIANAIAKQYPSLAPAMEESKQQLLIPSEEKLLNATELAALYSDRSGIKVKSAIAMNKLLECAGLQKRNPDGNPSWLPIGSGNEFSCLILETAKGRDKTIQSLKWYPSVVDYLINNP
jgi:prophage antirepressor-like protein